MKKETPKVVEEMWKEQVESREEEAEKEYAARCVHEVLDVLGDYYKDSTRCSELIEIVRAIFPTLTLPVRPGNN